MTRAIVLGLGGAAAGDDAVGLAVARALRDEAPAAGEGVAQGAGGAPGVSGALAAPDALAALDVRAASDAAALIELVAAGARVVVVDALVGGGAPGDVLALAPAALAAAAPRPVSSHGLELAAALELARVLHGDAAVARVAIVAVVIAPPVRGAIGLSPAVAAAVPRAAALARRLAAGA